MLLFYAPAARRSATKGHGVMRCKRQPLDRDARSF